MLWPSLTDHKSYVKTNMLGIYTSSFSLYVHELLMLSNVTQRLPGLTWCHGLSVRYTKFAVCVTFHL